MSAATIASQVGSVDQLFLRWSDDPTLPTREERVEVIEIHSSESLIRSPFRIDEETQVYLIGKHYTGTGIIRSCNKKGSSFILTILMDTECFLSEFLDKPDPGVFAVDSFLTEEEEIKILESLNNDICRRNGHMLKRVGFIFRQCFTGLKQIFCACMNAQRTSISVVNPLLYTS